MAVTSAKMILENSMTAFRRLATITLLGFVLLQKPLSGADTRTYDLVIYGTTSAEG